MIRTLLTTTAVALLLSAPAIAQDAAPATPAATTAPNPAITDLLAKGYQVADSDNLASRIIGQPVYTSGQTDADKIGDINDIVLTKTGQVGAVVIGVGGFLGVGEKNVAVDFSALKWTIAADNTERWVLPTTKDALNTAAQFQWRDDQPTNTAAANVTQGMQAATDTAANANVATPGAIDINGMTAVEPGTLTADKLKDGDVVGPDNQKIAEVGDILLTQDGKVDAMLIDFGGFLGIGQKRVAVGMDNLKFMQDQNGKLYVWVPFTKDQLNAAPQYDEKTYATDHTQRLVVSNG